MGFFNKLYDYACISPNVVAIEDDEQKITYGQLFNLICNNRKHLMENGICKCVIAYEVTKQVDFILDILSLFAAECWVIPIPSDVKFNVSSIDHKIKRINNNSFIRDKRINTDVFEINENLSGIYHMTSGSTGAIKLCKRSLASLVAEGEAYKELLSLNNKRIFSIAPVYHSFALGAAAFASLVAASSLRIIDQFIPRKAVSIIANWKANIVIGVPVMINAIALVSISQIYHFSCLSLILSGTGNVTKDMCELIKKRFGVGVSVNYGSTETGGLISRLEDEPYESIGKEMSGVKIKIVKKDGSLAKEDEPGEAYVKCPYMMTEYIDDDTAFCDGYFPMGDIMKKDINGYYYVVGRIKNIINIGGKKVNPMVVQKTILSYPSVMDCIVKKGIRKSGHEYIHALVVGNELDQDSIREYLSVHLNQYQMPSVIEFVSKIERNAVGKHIE